MAERDGGPAFPVSWEMDGEMVAKPGMSLRDYFAGQALAGLAATANKLDPNKVDATVLTLASTYAKSAYELADAMLEARETDDA